MSAEIYSKTATTYKDTWWSTLYCKTSWNLMKSYKLCLQTLYYEILFVKDCGLCLQAARLGISFSLSPVPPAPRWLPICRWDWGKFSAHAPRHLERCEAVVWHKASQAIWGLTAQHTPGHLLWPLTTDALGSGPTRKNSSIPSLCMTDEMFVPCEEKPQKRLSISQHFLHRQSRREDFRQPQRLTTKTCRNTSKCVFNSQLHLWDMISICSVHKDRAKINPMCDLKLCLKSSNHHTRTKQNTIQVSNFNEFGYCHWAQRSC